ncbi:hypothetical protein EVAR_13944_1 [Eumeta japonica]|uniref:Uncharacterized protein n=1 Tax=Eumeta variegata TaxID=151549 RepID=A0A4C1U8C1_EUMVA|nr:hypothetical protein EVAR_13944_1 [Eumeta japonica]
MTEASVGRVRGCFKINRQHLPKRSEREAQVKFCDCKFFSLCQIFGRIKKARMLNGLLEVFISAIGQRPTEEGDHFPPWGSASHYDDASAHSALKTGDVPDSAPGELMGCPPCNPDSLDSFVAQMYNIYPTIRECGWETICVTADCDDFKRISFLRGKRIREPPESRWSPPPIDAYDPRAVIGALPISLVEIAYLLERKEKSVELEGAVGHRNSLTRQKATAEAVISRLYSVKLSYRTGRADLFKFCSQDDHVTALPHQTFIIV